MCHYSLERTVQLPIHVVLDVGGAATGRPCRAGATTANRHNYSNSRSATRPTYCRAAPRHTHTSCIHPAGLAATVTSNSPASSTIISSCRRLQMSQRALTRRWPLSRVAWLPSQSSRKPTSMPPRYSHGCPTFSAILSQPSSSPAPCNARIVHRNSHMRTLGLTIVALQDYRRRCYSCPHSWSPPLPFDRVQAGASRFLQSGLAPAEYSCLTHGQASTNIAAKRCQRSHCRCAPCSRHTPPCSRACQ